MGNDPSKALADVIGEYTLHNTRFSEGQPWNVQFHADPAVVAKLLAFQRHTLVAMNNGTAPAAGIDDSSPQPASRDGMDPPRRHVRCCSLWRLNRQHPSINGDKHLANLAVWAATASSTSSKWLVPTYLSVSQDFLSLPGRGGCHVVRFYRGEPFEAMSKIAEDPKANSSAEVDVFLTSAGLYAPLLWYDSRHCERARLNRASIVPPAPPALGALSSSELMLGLIDICLGLCYLHKEHPLSSASRCSHNNVTWSSVYVRTDALGARLPWLLGDPRFSRVAATDSATKPLYAGAFMRSAKERDFTAPEVVRSEVPRSAFTAGDAYSFGRLVESAGAGAAGRDSDPVVAAARREMERFVAACQQSDAEKRPRVEDFLQLQCVRQCAFARLMRILDFFFPWAPEVAACPGIVDDIAKAEESAAASASEPDEAAATGADDGDADEESRREELAAAAKVDQLDSEDDIAQFSIEVAFGISPRQLPASVLVRVKALFFATLHLECLKIPNELFMRRVVPRLLDHAVFCSGAASPFMWQLLTPIRASSTNSNNIAPGENSLMVAEGSPTVTASAGAGAAAVVQVAQLPVCGLLQQNDLHNVLHACIEAGAALPLFQLEKGRSMNVMFERADNSRTAAAIAHSKRKHKVLLFLRGMDLLLAQASSDMLAKMLVPFVAACLASPCEYIVRAALAALQSIMNIVVEQKLAMQEKNPNLFQSSSSSSSSSSRQKRGGEQDATENRGERGDADDDEEEEEEEEEEEDENGEGSDAEGQSEDNSNSNINSQIKGGRRRRGRGRDASASSSSSSSRPDPSWHFAVVLTLRSLIKISQISLNETAQHDTQLSCFNLCVTAFNIGFAELQPKLLAVAQRIVANTSPTTHSSLLKLAALEHLYGPIQLLNKHHKTARVDSGLIAEVLPSCLIASQCPGNSGPVRSLSTKMLCIMLSICEQQNETNSGGVSASLPVLSDRWDAASSMASLPSLLGAKAVPLGGVFSGKSSEQQQQLGIYTARSVRNGVQVKVFARTERIGNTRSGSNDKNIVSSRSNFSIRRIAVMIPADFSLAALNPARPASASAIAWLSHDADQRLNAAQLLNAAAVHRFFSERADVTEMAAQRGHVLAIRLPTRVAEQILLEQQQQQQAAAAKELSGTVAAGAAGAGKAGRSRVRGKEDSATTSAAAAAAAAATSTTATAAASAQQQEKQQQDDGAVASSSGLRKRRAVAAALAAAAPLPEETVVDASSPQSPNGVPQPSAAATITPERKPALAIVTNTPTLVAPTKPAAAAPTVVAQQQQQQPQRFADPAFSSSSPAMPSSVTSASAFVASPEQQQQPVEGEPPQQQSAENSPATNSSNSAAPKSRVGGAGGAAGNNSNAVPRRRRAPTLDSQPGGVGAPTVHAIPAAMLDAVMDDL